VKSFKNWTAFNDFNTLFFTAKTLLEYATKSYGKFQ